MAITKMHINGHYLAITSTLFLKINSWKKNGRYKPNFNFNNFNGRIKFHVNGYNYGDQFLMASKVMGNDH